MDSANERRRYMASSHWLSHTQNDTCIILFEVMYLLEVSPKTLSTIGCLFWTPAGSRWATRGTCISETCLFWLIVLVFWGIHLRAISLKTLMNLICDICSEITLLELLPHLPRTKELNNVILICVPDLCSLLLIEIEIKSCDICMHARLFYLLPETIDEIHWIDIFSKIWQ